MDRHDLRKLSRMELLEMLVSMSEENERLSAEITTLNEELAKRNAQLTEAGSIAQSALEASGFFEAAEKAAQDYVDSVRKYVEQEADTQPQDIPLKEAVVLIEDDEATADADALLMDGSAK